MPCKTADIIACACDVSGSIAIFYNSINSTANVIVIAAYKPARVVTGRGNVSCCVAVTDRTFNIESDQAACAAC